MTGFSYENQGAHTYLSYEVKADEALNSMILGMLTHNKIDGLAETRFIQENETRYLKYDVTAKITVKQFFSGVVNKKRLLGVFSGVASALQSAEEYMIDVGDILLDTEYIFSDVSSYQTVLICLPLERENADQPLDAGVFFKQLIFNTQFDQSENCDYVAKIINYLNSAPVFSLKDFSALLNQLKSEHKAPAAPAVSGRPKTAPAQNAADHGRSPEQMTHRPPVREQPPRTRTDTGGQPVIKPPAPSAPVSAKRNPAPAHGQKNAPADTGTEKKMSALYLLRHYSKENLKLYKAQSATPGKDDKAGKKSKPSKGSAENNGVAPQKEKRQQPPAQFAVPGDRKSVDEDYPLFRNTDSRGGVSAPVPPKMPTPARPPEGQERLPYTPQPAQTGFQTGGGHQSAGFGDTIIVEPESGDGTIVPDDEQEKAPAVIKPHLIRQSNHEKVMIDKSLFRLGRERGYVDYCISDNRTVGRSHANIISRDGAFYIVDLNSRNHTYVNGEMIQSNTEVRIEHGTMISLARESFEFRLY